MLVLSRRINERIIINNNIAVTLTDTTFMGSIIIHVSSLNGNQENPLSQVYYCLPKKPICIVTTPHIILEFLMFTNRNRTAARLGFIADKTVTINREEVNLRQK